MTLTVEIPEKVVQHADAIGRPVAELVSAAIDHIVETPIPADDQPNEWEIRRGPPSPGFQWAGRPTMSPESVVAELKELASRSTLGGITVRELLEEDRRY